MGKPTAKSTAQTPLDDTPPIDRETHGEMIERGTVTVRILDLEIRKHRRLIDALSPLLHDVGLAPLERDTANDLIRESKGMIRTLSRMALECRRTIAAPKRGGKKHKRNRPSLEMKPLTEKQTEAAQIVGQCKGNISEAARRLGVTRKTVEQHYKAALRKMGETVVKQATRQLPLDRRGQIAVSEDRRRR